MSGLVVPLSIPSTLTPQKPEKLVVIMGPTGCGKTKLSLNLASLLFPNSSDIINSDKIQLHRTLDITTNKIPLSERRGIPHHLLGAFPPHAVVSPSLFRREASRVISDGLSQRRMPFLVGGSNSFIYALLAKHHHAENSSPFDLNDEDSGDDSSLFCKELRYDCCFINIHVEKRVLDEHLRKRVDDMIGMGMLGELRGYFGKYGHGERCGVGRAIGVVEIGRYLRGEWGYDVAVEMIKENTCRLAERQAWKIRRLREAAGWEMKTVDATASFRGGGEVWDRQVLEPSVKVVKRFLME